MEQKAKNRLLLVVTSLVAVTVGLVVGQCMPEIPFDFAKGGESKTRNNEESPSESPAEEDDGTVFVAFGHLEGEDAEAKMVADRVIVNLSDPSRVLYLNVMIMLETDSRNRGKVQEAVNGRRPVLKNWLTAYLSDKTLDEVRGKAGIGRMRREIQDEFNRLLFEGEEHICGVHFEEFNVQE